MKVLSQGKLNWYNIATRNLWSLCDFNDDFLNTGGKLIENISVANGWKPWLFVDGTVCGLGYCLWEGFGEQGWRSGESARLPRVWTGFHSRRGVIFGLSLLLVLYSAPRSFSPGTPVFPSPQKPTLLNSNSILECTDISERVPANSFLFRG